MPHFLDTNILLYSISRNPADTLKRERAIALLARDDGALSKARARHPLFEAERVATDDAQLSLGVLSLVLNERQQAQLDAALEAAKANQTIPEHTRRKPTGRKPLPEHLPRVSIYPPNRILPCT